VIGSHESIRLMRDEEVPEEQYRGRRRRAIRLSDDDGDGHPTASCIWANMAAPGEVCLGDMGLTRRNETRTAAL
jgi:hypothetical protein